MLHTATQEAGAVGVKAFVSSRVMLWTHKHVHADRKSSVGGTLSHKKFVFYKFYVIRTSLWI